MRRSIVAFGVVVSAVVIAACGGSGGDDSGAIGGVDGDPGKCTVVDMAVSSEKIALLTDLANEFNTGEGKRGRGQLRVRAAEEQGLRSRRQADRRRLARPRRQRPGTCDLVAGQFRLGIDRQRARRIHARSSRHPVHAHAARDRDAQADGRSARLPRQADRLRGHRRPRQRPRRLGRGRSSRMGTVPTRQDQSELFDEWAQLHDRRVLRRDRQDQWAHGRRSRATRSGRVRQERRVGRRALRRHHDDVPQQLVRDRPARHVAHVRIGSGG